MAKCFDGQSSWLRSIVFARFRLGSGCVGAAGDCAIYFEAPGPGGGGSTLIGGIFANNTVSLANNGIAVVNSGLYDDGLARRITISANQVTNITRTGIIVEGGCTVIGNTVETAGLGIVLGTNNATKELVACGNYLHSCRLGIGYSADNSATNILVSSNLIADYTTSDDPNSSSYETSGAIVSVYSDGITYMRDAPGGIPNTDYGNVTQTVVGSLTVGMNRAG